MSEDGVFWLSNGQTLRKIDRNHSTELAAPPGVAAYTLHQVLATPDHGYLMWFGSRFWTLTDHGWNRTALPIPSGFSPNEFFSDSAGRLWVGSSNGEFAYLEGGKAHVVSANASDNLGIVLSFFEDANGLLAGGFRGVSLLKQGSARRIHFEHADIVTGISGIVKDKHGDLWLNGLHGVIRVPREELEKAIRSPEYLARYNVFMESGSGPAPQFFRSAGKGDDGRLWFVTGNSLVFADPDEVHLNKVPPVISLLSLAADGSPLNPGSSVRPEQHTVRIAYFGADLHSPGSVTYRYRLDGVDDNWQNVGSRAEAVYTRLRPGPYAFHVMASNGDGVWSQPLETRFSVLPAFYQTTWFLLLCVLLGMASAWISVRWRVHQVAKTMSRLALERADERVRIARDLHDTLLQGVHSLLLQCDVARQYLTPETPAYQELSKALRTADIVLVEAREQVKGLRSPLFKEATLAEAFADLGAELRVASAAGFHVETRGQDLPLKANVSGEIYLAGREALTNAFRHAEASQIVIIIAYGFRQFSFICRDDGRGIADASSTVQGHWGMLGMRERASRIGGSFTCRTEANAGTEIMIAVPASRAYELLPAARELLKQLPDRYFRRWNRKAVS
ncbi:MAG TPA: triple tyrosine motif-containing protein [Acidobacteriaceae bacterium]|nr:triple tyrosine motif-containing protein [Acidobacteriaceae bacterium]